MNDIKIAVLLSSYNGEKYIKEQLESVLSQKEVNVELYVRDDGSADETPSILKQYEQEGKIHLKLGKNMGFIKSFLWLVKHCGEADYYAYCDQDDVWLPEKLKMAAEKMEQKDKEKPLLYFTGYDFYDGDMRFAEHGKKPKLSPGFRNSLVDCMTLGFNSVFNRAARDLIAVNIPLHSCGHDWWTYMVCSGLGHVIYDERVTVKYRRTGENVSPGGFDFVKFQIWRIKKFLLNNYFLNVRKQLKEFKRIYGAQLSPENQKILALFTQDGYHITNACKKVFYPRRFRSGLIDELMLRFMFLIGKL